MKINELYHYRYLTCATANIATPWTKYPLVFQTINASPKHENIRPANTYKTQK